MKKREETRVINSRDEEWFMNHKNAQLIGKKSKNSYRLHSSARIRCIHLGN